MRRSRFRRVLPVLLGFALLTGGPAAGVSVAAAPVSAPDSAVRLQALMGQHAVLAADLMRSRIRGDDDFVQAANAALGQNTDAVTALMRQLFGADLARRFAPLWSEHVVSLVAYASGVADQDDAARAHAKAEIVEYEEELSRFFAGASRGRLPAGAVHQALDLHAHHLVSQADAYAARDYRRADRTYRESYQQMYDLGRTLADGLLPARDRDALREPVWRLRSQLGRLLAEHVVLAEDVTRAAVTNTPDFAAAGQQINANTRDLTAAMDTLFGAPAARRFQQVWGFHVEQLVGYAASTAGRDQAGRETAQAHLHDYEQRMGALLSEVTGKRMDAARLSAEFRGHDEMLLRHADAYAARDYVTAHRLAQRTYEHGFELARDLADAFGATVAGRLPVGGPQTGYGGLAGDPRVTGR
ncbi:hypothetical protein BJY16_003508 [Actinoplanes octamycinicus]|uniref:Uncharacterized protein n=1 Tax=Actinoplanes octamycinicus TaxID=135948 RepID=A0A7W7GXC6_9ACTN|nr:hypothetical protein [Actinoplanes octamycinicus]MBB4740049.1 hypothetical protein [Actinoplanes octamycinicus]GIE59444.1 hypothetical protein Aoc01nite_48460 [Actinoplanes octamycinicus]